MIYSSGKDWLDASRKRVLLYGMSGLGKTRLAGMLRASGDGWFHYSVDYRIGTRHMDEFIADNAKAEAMKVPFLRELLLSDSIYIGSNISFGNLSPLSSYLGKPGSPDRGGLAIAEYRRRQEQFRQAEIRALGDTAGFIDRAERLYGYPHFVCDTGGSICEWVDGDDPDDPVLTELSRHCLLVGIEGDDRHERKLAERFDADPKPMCYRPEFLDEAWKAYLAEKEVAESDVDPDDFVRSAFVRALAERRPRYAAIARWGVTATAEDIAGCTSADAFVSLIAARLDDAAAAREAS